ncbi:MAG: YetF domain-containing protein [Bacillota bacterium]
MLEQLRKKNIFNVSDVEFSILETHGELSVLLKKEKQVVNLEDLFDQDSKVLVPLTVIIDGEFLEETI